MLTQSINLVMFAPAFAMPSAAEQSTSETLPAGSCGCACILPVGDR